MQTSINPIKQNNNHAQMKHKISFFNSFKQG